MLAGAKKSNPTHEILEIHLGDSGTLECTIVIVANVQGSSFKMFSILFALPALKFTKYGMEIRWSLPIEHARLSAKSNNRFVILAKRSILPILFCCVVRNASGMQQCKEH